MEANWQTVDRVAATKENDEVDRIGSTAEPDVVDRDRSTQENNSYGITLYVHPVPAQRTALLKGFHPPHSLQCSVGRAVIFGRGNNVDVFLNDDKASRTHMELTASLLGQQLVFKVKKLSKMPSSLLVNSENLQTGFETILKTSDKIQLNQLVFTVEINSNSINTNTDIYKLEFQMLQDMQFNCGIPQDGVPQALPQAGLPHNPGTLQAFGFIPPAGVPQAPIPVSHNMQFGAVPHIPMQTAPIFPQTVTSACQHQGQVLMNPMAPNFSQAQYAQGVGNPGQQIQSQVPINPMAPNFSQAQLYAQGVGNSGQVQQGQFPMIPESQNFNNCSQCIQGSAHPAQQHISVDQRREIFQQNTTSHIPIENEDDLNQHVKSISVEETQPPKLTTKTSVEETEPPKDI